MDSELRKEIEQAINKYSAENGSNTPDFILADYLIDCLNAFDKATIARENWYSKGKLNHVINSDFIPLNLDD